VCGLIAYTKAELELFQKHKPSPYERTTLCKNCDKKRHPTDTFSKKQNELIDGFPKPLNCFFCKKPIIKTIGQEKDSLAIHSLDGNHENWSPNNKVPVHNSCHIRHHRTGYKASTETRLRMSSAQKKH
jgi:5-methylcytosine-specific restriction endonuclease McrA